MVISIKKITVNQDVDDPGLTKDPLTGALTQKLLLFSLKVSRRRSFYLTVLSMSFISITFCPLTQHCFPV